MTRDSKAIDVAASRVLGSALGAAVGWSVQPLKPVLMTGPGGLSVTLVAAGAAIEPRSLLTAEGLYFMFSSMLRNFATMPALPLVFVSMLGVGLAEKFGFFSALMRQLAFVTHARLLTHVIDPSYSLTILHNFYFKLVSAFVVTAVGWWVTDRIVEPRLARLHPGDAQADDDLEVADMTLAPAERRALTFR